MAATLATSPATSGRADEFGKPQSKAYQESAGSQRTGGSIWPPFDPDAGPEAHGGDEAALSGEYAADEQTRSSISGVGLFGAVIFVYFLLVTLFGSYMTPLVVMSAVPIGVIGVVLMLYFTGTALNVQSLLGVIFMVGIVVANTVLLTDFAENTRKADRLTPMEAIQRAAAIRVRPVVMTAMATFFALIPMSLGLGQGQRGQRPPRPRGPRRAPRGADHHARYRSPALYSLVVPDTSKEESEDEEAENNTEPQPA